MKATILTLRRAAGVLVLVLVLSSALSGCIREDISVCPIYETFHLRAVDSGGEDITESGRIDKADLFIFDQNGNFVRKIELTAQEVANRVPLQISTNESVVAWGNIGNSEKISDITTQAASTVTLVMDGEGYAAEPGDLFYGEKQLTRSTAKEIIISPKVARVHVTVRGLAAGSDNEDYKFEIQQHNNGYTFAGIPTRMAIQSLAEGIFDQTNNFVTPVPINVIHTKPGTGDGIAVKLLDREGNTIVTADKDENGNSISPLEGQMANILIDMSGATITVRVEITDWGHIFQWADF